MNQGVKLATKPDGMGSIPRSYVVEENSYKVSSELSILALHIREHAQTHANTHTI